MITAYGFRTYVSLREKNDRQIQACSNTQPVVLLSHDAAVAEAVRQGAPEAAHAAMWPGPVPLGLDGRSGD